MRCTQNLIVRTAAVGVLASLSFAACSSDEPASETSGDGTTATTEVTESTEAPETTGPALSFPKPTVPAETAPAETTPAETTPPETAPAETTPPETAPADEPDMGDTMPDGVEYASYVSITDDTGLITLDVPVEWADVDGTPEVYANERAEPTVRAAPDLERYEGFWDTPGVEFAASTELATLATGELIDAVAPTTCVSVGRESYDDGVFTGEVEMFEACGGTSTNVAIIAAKNKTGDIAVVLTAQLATRADLAAFDRVQQSFNITI